MRPGTKDQIKNLSLRPLVVISEEFKVMSHTCSLGSI